MQTAGDGVATTTELTASVQLSHHHFHAGTVFSRDHVDRNTTAVVVDANAVVWQNGDFNMACVAGKGFVDGVVDDLVDQVVQAAWAGGTDVHAWAQAHSFQAFQHFEVGSAVVVRNLVGVEFSFLEVFAGDQFVGVSQLFSAAFCALDGCGVLVQILTVVIVGITQRAFSTRSEVVGVLLGTGLEILVAHAYPFCFSFSHTSAQPPGNGKTAVKGPTEANKKTETVFQRVPELIIAVLNRFQATDFARWLSFFILPHGLPRKTQKPAKFPANLGLCAPLCFWQILASTGAWIASERNCEEAET